MTMTPKKVFIVILVVGWTLFISGSILHSFIHHEVRERLDINNPEIIPLINSYIVWTVKSLLALSFIPGILSVKSQPILLIAGSVHLAFAVFCGPGISSWITLICVNILQIIF